MNLRTTLLLVAICAVLGGYVFWSGRSTSASTGTATPTPAEQVINVDTPNVDTIFVRDTHGNEVEATRSGSNWTLAKPLATAGDAAALSGTLDSLAKLTATSVITPPSADLTPYGLQTPTYVIQLRKGRNIVAELHVGDKNPNGNAVYVQPSTAKNVYLVSAAAIQTAIGWLKTPPIQPTPLPRLPPVTPAPSSSATATP